MKVAYSVKPDPILDLHGTVLYWIVRGWKVSLTPRPNNRIRIEAVK